MADEAQQPTPPAPTTPVVALPIQTAPAGPTPGIDTTDEGGRYVVNGQTVDADGNPIRGKK